MNPAGGIPPAIQAIFAVNPPAPGVGVVPPNALRFPADRNAVMTAADIGYLCRWYNDDMGITAGDSVQVIRNKFLQFLIGL
jgi:hypothetical protein